MVLEGHRKWGRREEGKEGEALDEASGQKQSANTNRALPKSSEETARDGNSVVEVREGSLKFGG